MLKTKRILIFIDWFEPGFKAGGPIRSVANFAEILQNDIDIYIITGDRDAGDPAAYPDISVNTWLQRQNYHVFYSSPGYLSPRTIRQMLKQISPDWIYLNAMFSWRFSILPVIVNHYAARRIPVLLAPRGMLKASALRFKHFKKSIFLWSFKILNMHKRLFFQATSDEELSDIAGTFGEKAKATLLPNLPGVQKEFIPIRNKVPGSLDLIFVGRIHPIKNLDYLLKALMGMDGHISLTIAGQIDDQEYWNSCRQLIQAFDKNIVVSAFHDIPHKEIEPLIVKHHLFFLPTRGENFGHAIYEALAAGRPVLISDQTPWRQLSVRHAGWDLDLKNSDRFKAVIEELRVMSETEINTWAYGAWRYCSDFARNSNDKKLYLDFFDF